MTATAPVEWPSPGAKPSSGLGASATSTGGLDADTSVNATAGSLNNSTLASAKSPTMSKLLHRRFSLKKAFAALLIVWLGQLAAVLLFNRGFLLTRLVLMDESQVGSADEMHDNILGSYRPTDLNPQFSKVIVLIIDALRFDMAMPFDANTTEPFHNQLKCPYAATLDEPGHSLLFKFIADAPTTTMQRLKGITTGSLPTFVEAGANFAGYEIREDSLLLQMKRHNKRILFTGDDTWLGLFPGAFKESYPFESFNNPDYWTVDNGVKEHLNRALAENSSNWDVFIGHFLGVDHIGHVYGPRSSQMREKLIEMEAVLTNVKAQMPEDALLVVMGDHGMDDYGNHGGDSILEVESALWLYSKRSSFAKDIKIGRPVSQIDLTSTLALLMGLPVPFNNLGLPIAETFSGISLKNYLSTIRATLFFMEKYLRTYTSSRSIDTSRTLYAVKEAMATSMQKLADRGKMASEEDFLDAIKLLSAAHKGVIDYFRSIWAHFDIVFILLGVCVSAASLISACSLSTQRPLGLFTIGKVQLFLCSVLSAASMGAYKSDRLSLQEALGASLVLSLLSIALTQQSVAQVLVKSTKMTSRWSMAALLAIFAHTALLASNSYTVFESNALLYIIASMLTLLLVKSCGISDPLKRKNAVILTVGILVLNFTSSFFFGCREEQGSCRAVCTTSSCGQTKAYVLTACCFVISAIFPLVLQQTWTISNTFSPIGARLTVVLLRLHQIGTAGYWVIQIMKRAQVIPSADFFKEGMVLARLCIGVPALAVWLLAVISIRRGNKIPDEKSVPTDQEPKFVFVKNRMVKIDEDQSSGFSLPSDKCYVLALICTFALITFVSEFSGLITISSMLLQAILLVDVLSMCGLQHELFFAVTMISLAGHYYFFATGHEIAFTSIQWQVAFLPFDKMKMPYSAMLVILNSFGAQIFSGFLVGLCSVAAVTGVNKKTESTPASQNERAMEQTSAAQYASVKQSTDQSVNLNFKIQKAEQCKKRIFQASLMFMIYNSVLLLASMVFAAILRRHLMVWKIFAPRYMAAAAATLTSELVGLLLGTALLWPV